jgi:hypothetical protein
MYLNNNQYYYPQQQYYPQYQQNYYPQQVAYQQPVVYQTQQYYPAQVTLSQVPYTGLDLGFWGTLAYWGFIWLWVFAAAYLVVVKGVLNRFKNWLMPILYGDEWALS